MYKHFFILALYIFCLNGVPSPAFSQAFNSIESANSNALLGPQKSQAKRVLEDTRIRLFDMIRLRGGNSQVILLTGDMVRNWKTAKQAFEDGNYAESERICMIIQKYIF